MPRPTSTSPPGRPATAGPDWPQPERRTPPLGSPAYAVREPLARWLRGEGARLAESRPGARVLDVGCGAKPYYPFFAAAAAEYVGVDAAAGSSVDVVGVVEQLPLPDGAFDVVLCTQVLEHCDDPARAVRELRRVTAPGGLVLASTHGVQVYHPSPQDLWRWTHAGLERLFADNGEWARLEVSPGGGSAACVAMLLGHFLDLGAKAARARAAARPLVGALNAAARAVDARVARLREPIPGTIFANFHVRAETPA